MGRLQRNPFPENWPPMCHRRGPTRRQPKARREGCGRGLAIARTRPLSRKGREQTVGSVNRCDTCRCATWCASHGVGLRRVLPAENPMCLAWPRLAPVAVTRNVRGRIRAVAGFARIQIIAERLNSGEFSYGEPLHAEFRNENGMQNRCSKRPHARRLPKQRGGAGFVRPTLRSCGAISRPQSPLGNERRHQPVTRAWRRKCEGVTSSTWRKAIESWRLSLRPER